ncbi:MULTISPECIES: hypothetical protein [Streptomyces]|uniref:Uncharacterized protein n=1 Tax=Streptomyces solicathayae TaxID=3081768 RepID=A0ABZ0LTT1_9ACTN|nr:hypothetical protein [Streptomyces sp. HUAS YS2]WOX22198.1 hypothetical protein R2D22_12690 [Streptomyces sp. HUAS YS2]
MTAVDPSEPDTFAEEAEAAALDEEIPEADAAEQHTELQQRSDELPHIDQDRANEADATEQARVVTQDEDDYR